MQYSVFADFTTERFCGRIKCVAGFAADDTTIQFNDIQTEKYMDLAICSFASSSAGNSYYIKSGEVSILVDTGLAAKTIDERLAAVGGSYDELSAIFVTHEHTDHIKCLHTLMKRRPFGGKVFTGRGTADALSEKTKGIAISDFEIVKAGDSLRLNTGSCTAGRAGVQSGGRDDLKIQVFRLSHDTPEPVGYTFERNGKKAAIVTDTGYITEEIFQAIRGCDVLFLEANHERNLLLYGRYPYSLKHRILSDTGHLSNVDCGGALCRFIRELDGEKLPQVVLSHLSSENNTPQQAILTVRNVLEENDFYVGRDLTLTVAPKDEISQIFVL